MPISPKLKEFQGLTKLAPGHIERNETEQALRAAQFKFDRLLHDLRSEFISREAKLRDEYLSEVAGITAGEGE